MSAPISLSPALKGMVDNLMARGQHFFIPAGFDKSGLLAYLCTKAVEFGVYRSLKNGQLYVMRGSESGVIPLFPGDKLIFHNHPYPHSPFLSTGIIGSDVSYLRAYGQRSTMTGGVEGTLRFRLPANVIPWDCNPHEFPIMGGTAAHLWERNLKK